MNNLIDHKNIGPSCKILIMDDDDEVREVLKKMLEKLGFEVVSTNKGEDTIKEYIQ